MPDQPSPKPDWAAVRVDYEARKESIKAIAARYGVSDTGLRRVAKQQGWTPRGEPRPSNSTTGRSKNRRSRARLDRKVVVRRLHRLIADNLKRMETAMTSDDPASPIDKERETRAIGKLIQNFERVEELETDRNRGHKKRAGDTAGDNGPLSPEETQRLSLELAERLYQLANRTRSRGTE